MMTFPSAEPRKDHRRTKALVREAHRGDGARSTSFARVFGLVSILASTACSATHECTEIGCSSQLSITLRTPTGAWPDGLYQLRVSTDTQREGLCTFLLPDALPSSPGSVQSLDCGSTIRLELSPELECTMGCDGNACWQKCTPIAGKFVARVSIDGTPARVDLNLMRDQVPILAEMATPSYQDVYPNGPDCGPVCRQATLEYMLP